MATAPMPMMEIRRMAAVLPPAFAGFRAPVDETDPFPGDEDRSGQKDHEDQAERTADKPGQIPHEGHDEHHAPNEPAGGDGVQVLGVVRVPLGHEAEPARSLDHFGHPVGDERGGLAGRIRGLSST